MPSSSPKTPKTPTTPTTPLTPNTTIRATVYKSYKLSDISKNKAKTPINKHLRIPQQAAGRSSKQQHRSSIHADRSDVTSNSSLAFNAKIAYEYLLRDNIDPEIASQKLRRDSFLSNALPVQEDPQRRKTVTFKTASMVGSAVNEEYYFYNEQEMDALRDDYLQRQLQKTMMPWWENLIGLKMWMFDAEKMVTSYFVPAWVSQGYIILLLLYCYYILISDTSIDNLHTDMLMLSFLPSAVPFTRSVFFHSWPLIRPHLYS